MPQWASLLGLAFLAQADPHVRPLDPAIRSAIEQGAAHSPTVFRQIGRLQASDVIVYVRAGSCSDSDVLACTRIVPTTPGATRLLQMNLVFANHKGITVLSTRQDHLIAVIAHELQHAIEVADAPDVVDGTSLRRLFERIGYRLMFSHGFETDAAVRVGDVVRQELRHGAR